MNRTPPRPSPWSVPPSGPSYGPGSSYRLQPPYDTAEEPIYVAEPPPPGFPGYGDQPSAPAGAPAAASGRVSEPILGWLLLGTAVLAVLGAVLPWATVFGEAILGTAGDGQLVIACAVAVGACAIGIGLGHGRLWISLAALAFALLIALIALVDIANVSSVVTDDGIPVDGMVQVGGGLWLTLLAGIASVGVCALAVIRREPAGAPPCAEPPGPAA